MYIHRVIFKGGPGQLGVLRETLRSVVRPENRTILAERLWGDGPCFVVLTAYETLAAVQTAREAFVPDPKVAAQLVTSLRVPPMSELWDVPGVAAAPVAGAAPAARFTVRFTFHPASGKGIELAQACQAFVERQRAAGTTYSLWQRVSGGTPAVALVTGFADMAALEATRAAAIADPAVREWGQKVAGLVATTVETPDIFELLAQPR